MKRLVLLIVTAGLLFLPVMAAFAEDTYGAKGSAPPVAQQLVREGDYALDLAPALGLGTPDNEAAAESMLTSAGIAPHNGWIADYPVTPDIVGELQEDINVAANNGSLKMKADVAVKAMWDLNADLGLQVRPAAGEEAGTQAAPPTEENLNRGIE